MEKLENNFKIFVKKGKKKKERWKERFDISHKKKKYKIKRFQYVFLCIMQNEQLNIGMIFEILPKKS